MSFLTFILIAGLVVFAFSPVFLGVPFMPTHRRQAIKMMDLSGIKPGMNVVDLGSGSGRLLFLAAERGANAVGYELNPFLVLWTRLMILLKGKSGQVKVFYRSIYKADISKADIIFLFLYPAHMKKLEAKIFSESKPEVKILCYVFKFQNYHPIAREEGVYVYKKTS